VQALIYIHISEKKILSEFILSALILQNVDNKLILDTHLQRSRSQCVVKPTQDTEAIRVCLYAGGEIERNWIQLSIQH